MANKNKVDNDVKAFSSYTQTINVLEGTLKIESAIYTDSDKFNALTVVMRDTAQKLFKISLENAKGGIAMQYCENLPTNVYIFGSIVQKAIGFFRKEFNI